MVTLLRVRDAARILACCERSVWRLLDDGELTRIRVGKSVRIEAADIENFLERQRVRGADAK